MRIVSVALLGSFLLVACKSDPSLPGDTAGASTGETGTSTTDDPTTTATTMTTNGGGTCVPGQSAPCACTDGGSGAQVCNADGKSFGECVCEGGSNSDSQGDTTTTDPGMTATSDPGTTEPGMTATSDPGTTGPVGSTGPDTTTGVVPCEDSGEEPNEDEDSAIDLGDQGCQAEPKSFMGVLVGDADVDWYTYHGLYGFNCGDTDPEPSLTLQASADVRMCVFADCDMSNAVVTCQDGADMAMSPGNLPGCCNQGDVTMGINCAMTGNESAQIFVRLDQAPADSCVDYSVEYDYQGA